MCEMCKMIFKTTKTLILYFVPFKSVTFSRHRFTTDITENMDFYSQVVVVGHAFNTRTREAGAGEYLCSRPVWFTD